MAENAARVGAEITKQLKELQEEHKMLNDVQGRGLVIGAEIVTDKDSRKPAPDAVLTRIQKEAAHRGVLFGRGGLY